MPQQLTPEMLAAMVYGQQGGMPPGAPPVAMNGAPPPQGAPVPG